MACEKLQSLLPGKIILKGSEGYDTHIDCFNFRSARQRPLCIVNVASVEDVSKTLKALSEHPDTPFAIKSGGHSPHADDANTDTGILIDLKCLNTIAQSKADEEVYELGVGGSWGKVYEALSKSKRAVSGSRETDVGIGGLITGGGLTYFSPERGFGCDDVINMQVVLASGEIVDANANSNADLFRSLKGGKSNFGIVTRVDVKTHAQDTIWGGAIMYPLPETEDAQLEAFWNFKNSDGYDKHAQVELSFISRGPNGSFVSNNHWYGRHFERPASFEHFQKIQPQIMNSMRFETTANFAKELSKFQPREQFSVFLTSTFILKDKSVMKKINSLWHTGNASFESVQGILSVFTYQQCPPPPPADRPNAMGFPPDSKPHEDIIIIAWTIYWDLDSDSNMVRDKARETMEEIDKLTKAEGMFHPFKYMNYAAPWQNVLESYGDEAYAALKSVAEKYDPKGMFRKQGMHVGFKL